MTSSRTKAKMKAMREKYGTVSLQELMEAGLVEPGEYELSEKYRTGKYANMTLAELLAEKNQEK